MDQTAITAAIRIAIKKPQPRDISDADITAVTLRAVKILGLKIKDKDPHYYNDRYALTSNTNVFSFPSTAKIISKVWDYQGKSIAISGAANATGLIRITATAHGFADGAIVKIHDVLGCTEANGTWKIDYITADTFDLLGSTFANAYSSGGRVFEEKTNMTEIKRIHMADQTNHQSNKWFPRDKKIVIDDVNFENDIIIDFEKAASAITDIPDEYHEYLISWPVTQLMDLGKPDEPGYDDKVKALQFHSRNTKIVENDILKSFNQSSESLEIRDVLHFDDEYID